MSLIQQKSYAYVLLGESLFKKCMTIGASEYELVQRLQELGEDYSLNDLVTLCRLYNIEQSDIPKEITVNWLFENFAFYV